MIQRPFIEGYVAAQGPVVSGLSLSDLHLTASSFFPSSELSVFREIFNWRVLVTQHAALFLSFYMLDGKSKEQCLT